MRLEKYGKFQYSFLVRGIVELGIVEEMSTVLFQGCGFRFKT